MAVDFSLLPAEEQEIAERPSRVAWAIAFLVMVLGGVLAVLLSWPKHLPTHTWKFWATLIVFPVGVPVWIVLRRYGHHEGRKLDVLMRNEAIRKYNEHVFAVAARPLAVLGVAHRISSDRNVNALASIQAGTVRIGTQEPIANEGDPVRARWLEVPGVELVPGGKEKDDDRQRKAMQWLYSELLDDLAERIRALPLQTGFGVSLWISGGLHRQDHAALWEKAWQERQFRAMDLIEEAEPAGLHVVDGWLDEIAGQGKRDARLIVAIQLHPVLSDTPPPDTAEAGVAVLLMPDEAASRLAVEREASLHRPVRGPVDQSNGALLHALKWGDTKASDITKGWQTGFDAAMAGVLHRAAMQIGLETQPIDLDQTVGHAGVAASWLAVACAAGSLSGDAPSQIILVGGPDGVDAAVIRRQSHETRPV
ncbi:hypothetical protein CupriaWKF_25390 [Cupriavidus sp. WKF15]|uniref:hypothetical protein n=1 Tax=Cupriavidus sp. WKF15 TaxID=3032282 RepID=UPI0023E215D7|nr:hypothetical protein [Cupriavidus sp. WKF15]WER48141.1 hypothetical protein CupriaWKF_25390 [Cupriavidus sp. WKF15]